MEGFEIDAGAAQYDFELDEIVGSDFLRHIDAVIDFARPELFTNNSGTV